MKSGLSSEKTGQEPGGPRSLYESWIRGYRAGPLRGALGIEQREIELEITVVEGDDLDPDPKTAAIMGPHYRIAYSGCAVSVDGTVSYFHHSATGVKGGGLVRLAEDELERLNQLVGQIPEDNSTLPPVGHRLVLQVATGSEVLARVYDRANAPNSSLEILRLSHSGIRPLTLDFPPQKKWPLTEFDETGIPTDAIGIRGPDMEESTILATSFDRYLIVRQVLHDTALVTITDPNPLNVIRTLREPPIGERFAGITRAFFSPDNRYLLLLTSLPSVRIYETTNWKQVRSLPDLPPAAVSYYPSSDWKRGVFVNSAGNVALWDAESRREVSKLDTDGKLFDIAFSPDDSMFATTTGHQNKDMSSTLHLRIWGTPSGELLQELRPFEQAAHDDIGSPTWWPDGKYLLATVRDGSSSSGHDIGIWSVGSGRFRGEFSGCTYSADPLSLVLENHNLFDRCRDGMILMWDAATAIGKVTAYEKSLNSSREDN